MKIISKLPKKIYLKWFKIIGYPPVRSVENPGRAYWDWRGQTHTFELNGLKVKVTGGEIADSLF